MAKLNRVKGQLVPKTKTNPSKVLSELVVSVYCGTRTTFAYSKLLLLAKNLSVEDSLITWKWLRWKSDFQYMLRSCRLTQALSSVATHILSGWVVTWFRNEILPWTTVASTSKAPYKSRLGSWARCNWLAVVAFRRWTCCRDWRMRSRLKRMVAQASQVLPQKKHVLQSRVQAVCPRDGAPPKTTARSTWTNNESTSASSKHFPQRLIKTRKFWRGTTSCKNITILLLVNVRRSEIVDA